MFVEIGYVLAGLLVIMIPGFLFSVALFPRAGGMDVWKRIGSTAGLGMMLVIYEAAALAKLKSLTASPFLISVVILTIGLGIAVYFRKGTPVVRAYISGALNLPKRISGIKFPKVPKMKIGRKTTTKPEEKPESKIKCPFCGNLNPPDVTFCIECGKRLKSEPEKPVTESKPVNKKEGKNVQIQTSDRSEG